MRIFGDRPFSLSGKLLITAVLLGLMCGCGWLLLQMAGVIVLGFMLVFSYPLRSLHYYVNKALFVNEKVSVSVGKAPQLRRTFSDYLDYCAQMSSPRANKSEGKSQREGCGTTEYASGFVFPAATGLQCGTQKWIEEFFSFIESNSALLALVSTESRLRCDSYCQQKSALVDAVKDKKIEDFLKDESKFFEFSAKLLKEILSSPNPSVNEEVRLLIYGILKTLKNTVWKSSFGSMGSSRSAFNSAFPASTSDLSLLCRRLDAAV